MMSLYGSGDISKNSAGKDAVFGVKALSTLINMSCGCTLI